MENYAKVRLVGRGAHGSVFLCRRLSDSAEVIVKEIPVEESESAAALGEAALMSVLSHPLVVRFHHAALHNNSLSIVMDFARGGTLADFIAARKGCLLTETQILHIFAQLVLSLHYLHSKQILHRDLKGTVETQNVLLKYKNSTVCQLSDFGIAKSLMTGASKAATVVGTPNYMSPEICQGLPYCVRSDVWSLGCVLLELITLKRAFEAQSLNALVVRICGARPTAPPISDHFSGPLKKLSRKLLEMEPSARPSTQELLATPILVHPIHSLITTLGALPGLSTTPPRPTTSTSPQLC